MPIDEATQKQWEEARQKTWGNIGHFMPVLKEAILTGTADKFFISFMASLIWAEFTSRQYDKQKETELKPPEGFSIQGGQN